MKKQNIMMLVLVVFLAFFPLYLQKEAEFAGADDKASELINAVNPDYKPWFESVWKPPSSEVESFLFALQAGIGAGFVGYFFGWLKGRKSQGHANENKIRYGTGQSYDDEVESKNKCRYRYYN